MSFFQGFFERELTKDDIEIVDTSENPEAPLPSHMIELEVNDLAIYLALGINI